MRPREVRAPEARCSGLPFNAQAKETCLFISTNVTTQKRDGRNCVLKFFSQGLEEMHHELSKDGENHKLGYVNIPTEPKTLLVCTRLTSVFRSMHFIA